MWCEKYVCCCVEECGCDDDDVDKLKWICLIVENICYDIYHRYQVAGMYDCGCCFFCLIDVVDDATNDHDSYGDDAQRYSELLS